MRQADDLMSNLLNIFECNSPGEDATFGETAENIDLTTGGGPLLELTADAYLYAVSPPARTSLASAGTDSAPASTPARSHSGNCGTPSRTGSP
ncbi:hypothetical protein [Nonomuraea jiangxiensis]|uniref:hypothetical protein n=1 Tax=Nonomuraea jiangxiensis TaxID=633440 RepID=UPI00115FAF90|nr:hypothetical protein [Nonomuraea jiangxiensis]